MTTSTNPKSGMMVAIVGLLLIIAGGAYALYERYVVNSGRLSQLIFNPVVAGLAVIGLVLLIAGVAMYSRKNTVEVAQVKQQ